jgi:CheY-like chemotaxis protein
VLLTDAGYEDKIASGGPEARRVAEAQPRPFDLFVPDTVIREMNGDEFDRRLRQRDPDVEVLYFTGHSDRLFENRPTPWQWEAFLEKPITPKGLLEAVSLLLFGHTQRPSGGLNPAA